MKEQWQIAAYHVPVRYHPDVCVIGAGAAGLAAAVGAARTGLSVLLIEKYGFSGGAAVGGLSGTICGMFSSGSRPQQIVFGFAGEFYAALKQRHGIHPPVRFGNTLLVPHDSNRWKELADDLLLDSNCRVLYHTHFLNALRDDAGRVTGLLVKGQQGQFLIRPKVVIDASGDAELIHTLGEPSFMGKEGVVQTPTMIFKMANVDMEAFLQLNPTELVQKVKEAAHSGNYRLPRHHVYAFPLPNAGEVLCNMTKITYPDGSNPLGTVSEDLTFAEMEGRRQAREYARFLVNEIPAFQKAYLSTTGVHVGIRQTRSIAGKGILLNSDVIQAVKRENAVTLSAWPMEIHNEGEVKIVQLENDHYDIPLETLIPRNAGNYLAAGRCLSAEHEALASARVTAQCFGMGYAAGAAAGLMIKEGLPAIDLDGGMVAHWMKQHKLKNSYEQ